MKKIGMVFVFFLLLFGLARGDGLLSSGEKTSDTAIHANNCWLGGLLIITDGTNNATLKLYDNGSAATGTKLWEAVVSGTDNYGGGLFPHWIYAANGIYADLTGTGASVIVYYVDANADNKMPMGP